MELFHGISKGRLLGIFLQIRNFSNVEKLQKFVKPLWCDVSECCLEDFVKNGLRIVKWSTLLDCIRGLEIIHTRTRIIKIFYARMYVFSVSHVTFTQLHNVTGISARVEGALRL